MSDARKEIPITPLRTRYLEMMANSHSGGDLAQAKAMTAETLAKEFCQSVEVFKRYENVEVAFVGDSRAQGDNISGHLGEVKRNINLAAIFQARGNRDCSVFKRVTTANQVMRCEDLVFTYIDREIVPARTPKGKFVDQKGKEERFATKNLSADLLLRSVDRRPIIAEIKLDGGKNPYLGLIELLMYAAEMVTENQVKRLLEQYPDKFEIANASTPQFDLSLLLVRYNENLSQSKRKVMQDLLNQTEELSTGLFKQANFSKYIRRIVCLHLDEGFTVSKGIDLKFRAGG
jgi:hypothetical protein